MGCPAHAPLQHVRRSHEGFATAPQVQELSGQLTCRHPGSSSAKICLVVPIIYGGYRGQPWHGARRGMLGSNPSGLMRRKGCTEVSGGHGGQSRHRGRKRPTTGVILHASKCAPTRGCRSPWIVGSVPTLSAVSLLSQPRPPAAGQRQPSIQTRTVPKPPAHVDGSVPRPQAVRKP
jgi:hypothetical protein